MSKIVRRRGYVSESERFNSYVAQINAASQNWSGQPAPDSLIPEGLLRREYAWRKGDLVSEVVIPFCHSLGYSVIGSGIGAMMTWSIDLPTWRTVFACGMVTFGATFIISTRNMLRSMWTIEEFGSEEVEELPSPTASAPREVRVTLESADGKRYRFAKLHTGHNPDRLVTEQQLTRLAIHCVANGRNFSRPELCQRANILSQSEYHTLREDMLAAGLLRDAGGNNTVELSPSGRAVLRQFLD